MCEWCDKLDLTRTFFSGHPNEFTRDYSRYVHAENGPNPAPGDREAWRWWGYHNIAVELFKRRKLEAEAEAVRKKEKKNGWSNSKRLCEIADGDFMCLHPSCSKEITASAASQSGLCSRHRQQLRRYEKKRRLFALCGGRCEICDQIPQLSAISFHHVDPSTKKFAIGERINMNEDALIKELSKCIAVCENCHRELHSSYDDELFVFLSSVNW